MNDVFTVKIQELDRPNKNGRIYPKSVVEEALRRAPSTMYGTLGYPEGLALPIDKVSHSVSNLRIEGDYLVGDAKILKTPMGAIVEKMLMNPESVAYRTMGYGMVGEDGVISDFTIIAVAAIPAEDAA